MNYRMITPYSDCPALDSLSMDLDELENLSIDIDETMTFAAKKQQTQQKRKQQNKYARRMIRFVIIFYIQNAYIGIRECHENIATSYYRDGHECDTDNTQPT